MVSACDNGHWCSDFILRRKQELMEFLTGLFVIGPARYLQTASIHTYHTRPIESAAKAHQHHGICNKGAGAIAP